MAIASFSLTTTKGYTSRAYTQQGASSQELWDNIHDGAGNGSGSLVRAGWSEGESWNAVLYRGYLGFDTSAIPSDATITDAYVKISGTEYFRNAARDCIIGSAGTTNSFGDNITTTDYGTWSGSGSGGSGSGNFSNIQVDFNTSGRSAINKTGDTRLSWRYAYDTTDTVAVAGDSHNYVNITAATLYVVYQVDEARTLTEEIDVTESFTKDIQRIMSDIVRVGAWIVGRGNNVIVTYAEALAVSASINARTLKDFVKELTSQIVMFGSQKSKKNGTA